MYGKRKFNEWETVALGDGLIVRRSGTGPTRGGDVRMRGGGGVGSGMVQDSGRRGRVLVGEPKPAAGLPVSGERPPAARSILGLVFRR